MSSRQSAVTDQNIITSLNRGPIKSLFVHPASCTATLTFANSDNEGNGNFYFGHHGNPVSAECYPTGSLSAPPLSVASAWQGYYYSPAICPSGWTKVTTFTSSMPFFPPSNYISLGPETTAALCCPAGFVYYQNGCQCKSTITASQTVAYVWMTFDGQQQNWIRGSTITQRPYPSTVVSGDGVPIMWQSKDAEVLARASIMPDMLPSSDTGIATSTSETTEPSNTSETNISPPGRLSTGAKIGIGAGIPIAVIVALVLGFFLWNKRRTQKAKHKESLVYDQHGVIAEEKETIAAPMHFAGQEIHELHSAPEAYHNRHELSGVARQY